MLMSIYEKKTPSDQIKCVKTLQISHIFQNLETCLHIFLTMPVTNCSSETLLSFLERIENRLKSSLRMSWDSYPLKMTSLQTSISRKLLKYSRNEMLEKKL